MRICVYAGSNPGANPAYAEAAADLARLLTRRGIGIVYGGAHRGLMGILADTALEAGGEVIGVMPQALVDREIAHTRLTELHVVASMHERKALMASLADGFVALPGGLGTLEEMFEILTWAQLGIHQKPVGVLDVDGYWTGLLGLLRHAAEEGFVRPEYATLLLVESRADALLERFAAWRPSAASPPIWLDVTET